MVTDRRTYKDFNGTERTENFYFNLTEAEILSAEFKTEGGLATKLQNIIDKKDGVQIMETFEWLLDKSYGVKSEDGRTFKKTKEALEDYKSTNAYAALYTELCTNADKAIAFVNGVIPDEVRKQVELEQKKNNSESTTVEANVRPFNPATPNA